MRSLSPEVGEVDQRIGQIPIDIATREAADRGMPIVGEDRQSPVTAEFMKIAQRIREMLA